LDYLKVVLDLRKQKERIKSAIAALEAIQGSRNDGTQKKRRGRHSPMPPAERAAVSERMQRYWAKRKRSGEQEPVAPRGERLTSGSDAPEIRADNTDMLRLPPSERLNMDSLVFWRSC
jgi:hypothetical protein